MQTQPVTRLTTWAAPPKVCSQRRGVGLQPGIARSSTQAVQSSQSFGGAIMPPKFKDWSQHFDNHGTGQLTLMTLSALSVLLFRFIMIYPSPTTLHGSHTFMQRFMYTVYSIIIYIYKRFAYCTYIHISIANCVSLHQTSHFFQSHSLLWLVLRPKSQASVHPKLWVLAWRHRLRTWFFSVMHGFCSMHSMPWNPASLQEIHNNNIWQYHIPVYSAQKSTKSNDYETSMACRNVCEMQRRRQIVRCSNEWVLGFWDANEMPWKNIINDVKGSMHVWEQ